MSKLFSPQQTQAISLLAQGFTDVAVAKEISVDKSTIWRWKQNPDFLQAVDAELEAIQKDVKRILRSQTINAAKRIGQLVDEEDCPPRVQLDAAKEVLNRVAAIEPQAPNEGIPVSQAVQMVDEVCNIATDALDAQTGMFYQLLGLVNDPDEYREWSDSKKAFYACQLDWISKWLEGDSTPTIDPEMLTLWQWAWQNDDDQGRQWLTAIDCECREIVQVQT
jgi:hypothetical protein